MRFMAPLRRSSNGKYTPGPAWRVLLRNHIRPKYARRRSQSGNKRAGPSLPAKPAKPLPGRGFNRVFTIILNSRTRRPEDRAARVVVPERRLDIGHRLSLRCGRENETWRSVEF